MPPSAPSCSTYPVPLLPTENTQPPGTRTGLSEPRSAPHFAQYELWPDDRARDSALAAEVQAILDEAEAVDAAEDQLYGDARGDELPPELRTREGQLARTREAKARERTGNQAAVPAPKAQRNFTDPQSRIMLSKPDGWVQGYNVGIAVDETAQVIVATSVTVETTDTRQLPALVDQIKDNTVARRGVSSPTPATAPTTTSPPSRSAASTPTSQSVAIITGRRCHHRRGVGSRPGSHAGSGWASSSGPRLAAGTTRDAR